MKRIEIQRLESRKITIFISGKKEIRTKRETRNGHSTRAPKMEKPTQDEENRSITRREQNVDLGT